jgi:hypothetical protein
MENRPSPPKCVATAKHTGKRCGKWPVPGATVCKLHGGMAPQVKRKAAVRVALREALERGDRRPLWEILLETVHASDVLFRDAQVTLGENGEVTPEQLDRLVESIDRTSRLSKIALDARVDEAMVRQFNFEAELLWRLLYAGLRAVGLDEDQMLVARKATADEALRIEAEQLGQPTPTGSRVITGSVVAG